MSCPITGPHDCDGVNHAPLADLVQVPAVYWSELIEAIEAVLDDANEHDGNTTRTLLDNLDNAYFVAFTEARTDAR